MAGTTFTMTLIGRGYPSHVDDVEKSHDDLPTQSVITRVTGPGQHHASPACCLAIGCPGFVWQNSSRLASIDPTHHHPCP